ncbi:MAG TPA: DUF445 domain-containing protein [Gemmatimonadales bacterium]|jgi:uncharacterized membrane-anchored protein YjiN (DUF445 family)|nr:DUF445 domain-containing protein [Gemmatimonadales bacterium]
MQTQQTQQAQQTPQVIPGAQAVSVSPQWGRPDDAERQARLEAMKRRATGLLAVALLVFVAASLYESQFPWLGYVRATAEASLVGGLADWFAVTALFRHPLGIPIPHTAIVATRKERIGQILGNFVQNHFLSRDVIAANLRRVHPAERAAQWLADREHAKQISRQFASGLVKTLDGLPPNELQDLVSQVVRNRVRTFRVAPALGKTLALALGDNRQEELLNATVKLAAEAVRNNRELIRERVRAETPWWVPPVVDDKIYQKIIAAVERLLQDMVMDPAHPLRTAFDNAIRDFIERLQHSPEVIARAEALKEEWLMGAQTDELARKLWDGIRQAVRKYAAAASSGDGTASPGPGPLDSGLSEFGVALLSNPTLLADIDDLLIDVTAGVVEKYRHEIGDLIAQTVASWDAEATSRRFELAVGRDLQFVRINGTLVGGLVGLLIYTITRVLR